MKESPDVIVAESSVQAGGGVTKYNLKISPRLYPRIKEAFHTRNEEMKPKQDAFDWWVIGFEVRGAEDYTLVSADTRC